MAQILTRANKAGDPRYTARVRLNGRQATKTFASKKSAQTWARKIEGDIEQGRFGSPGKRRPSSVGKVIETFIEDHISRYEDARTMKARLQWWKTEIGSIPIRELSNADIATGRDKLAKRQNRAGNPVTGSTINRYIAALSTVLQWAVQDERLIEVNPARQTRRPKVVMTDPQFIEDRKDIDALRIAAAKDRDPMALPLILTVLATGMRRGELYRLRWPDVNLREGLLHIPKTKNGKPRTLRLAGATLKGLEAWSKVRRLADDRVFPPYDDGGDGRTRIDAIWRRLRKTTPRTDVKFHGLRHTAGTWLSQEGFHPSDIARVLGHKSLAMALVYQHLTDQRRDEIANKLTHAMFGEEGA